MREEQMRRAESGGIHGYGPNPTDPGGNALAAGRDVLEVIIAESITIFTGRLKQLNVSLS